MRGSGCRITRNAISGGRRVEATSRKEGSGYTESGAKQLSEGASAEGSKDQRRSKGDQQRGMHYGHTPPVFLSHSSFLMQGAREGEVGLSRRANCVNS